MSGIHEAVEAFRLGRIVMVTDPTRPERGAVVAAAAERTNDDTVNFMANHARGLVALSMLPERAERLGLGLQGPPAGLERENYTVSIEAREGVSTGISAADRARTIQVAVEHHTRPEDIVTPGHVFPAIADPGGVVARAGWAEATLDLARIAGSKPAATFCHVLDDDGELATGEALTEIAERLALPQVSIAALIAHRMASESFVTLLTQATVPTAFGDFMARVFVDTLGGRQHVALTLGELRSSEPVLVRLHSECLTGDVFASQRCDCGKQLEEALRRIREAGRGVLLYLRQEGRGIGIVDKIRAYALQDAGRDTVEANLELGHPADSRDFGLGAQMLLALGVHRVRLMTNNPRKVNALASYGLDVVAREGLEIEPTEQTRKYLATKKQKLGHLLDKI